MYQIRMVRPGTTMVDGTWRLPKSPAIVRGNIEYLSRRPHKIYGGIPHTGGEDNNTPISTFGKPSDYGYYLFELETLIHAAATVGHNIPYGEIFTSNKTVRNIALNHVAEWMQPWETPLATTKLKGSKMATDHWTGRWYFIDKSPVSYGSTNVGILRNRAILLSYPNPRGWASKAIYRNLFCQEIAPIVSNGGFNIKLYKKGDPYPIQFDDCKGCHYVLDGIANLRFENPLKIYTDSRRFSKNYYDLFNFQNDPGALGALNVVLGLAIPAMPQTHFILGDDNETLIPFVGYAELGQILSKHRTVKKCLAKRLFSHIYRREPAARDFRTLSQAVLRYENTNQSFKELLKFFLMRKEFYRK